MKRTTLSNHINALMTETEMILRFQLALNRILKFDDLNSISRSNFIDRLISLKAIENDLVIRICKFDDNTKGVHSFKKALTEISTTHLNKSEINKKVAEFSQLISKLKKERRHNRLAHLRIGVEDNDYQLRYNLMPAIKLIVYIIDLMKETKVLYSWKDGKYDEFDLRKEVLNET